MILFVNVQRLDGNQVLNFFKFIIMGQNSVLGKVCLGAGWLFAGMSGFPVVQMVLSSIASALAIYNFWLQIKKNQAK